MIAKEDIVISVIEKGGPFDVLQANYMMCKNMKRCLPRRQCSLNLNNDSVKYYYYRTSGFDEFKWNLEPKYPLKNSVKFLILILTNKCPDRKSVVFPKYT